MKKNILAWVFYSILFTVLLIPYTNVTLKTFSGGLILGFFAGIINSLRKCKTH